MGGVRSGAAVQVGERKHAYYEQERPDVAALVPAGARRVLDVGCGAGALGKLLQQRGHHVSGIELVPEAAEQARQQLDHVETGDVEADGFPFSAATFDAVVFADVLEHFVDPWRVLKEAASLLVPGGCVVASIPNLQNIDVLRRLIMGRWQYRERGINDFGHLRFFTLQTIRHLFAQAGLNIVRVDYRYRGSWSRTLLTLLTAGRARAYFARQYLVVGQKLASC